MKHFLFCLGAAAVALSSFTTNAAMLGSVPMQGGMVMPMLSYQAADSRFHVMMPTDVPRLTPLLVSNPDDSFDPADPWFDSLDPSRRGESFSRRYGFVMDANTDLLPAGTEMWIRKLSGSPELKSYHYRDSAPELWEPIFGTDGVTNALHWNGMMFHPAFTAPPGTNELTATFEVYLLDTATGLEAPNSSSGPLVFNWTNISDGRPELHLEPSIVVGWPAETTTNWILEFAESADATTWTTVTDAPVVVHGQPCVVLEAGAAGQFFRMRYAP